MSIELIDELEAGELSVEFEGEEPQELLEWALERFAPADRALDRVPDRRRRAARHGVRDRPEMQVFSVDTGRLPPETLRADRAAAASATRPRARGAHARGARRSGAWSTGTGPNLFYELGREPPALLQRPQGAAADPVPRRPRRVDHGPAPRPVGDAAPNIRKVEIDHDHGAIVKLNPLAEWTEEEVWDYVREREVPYHALYEQGYTSIGCAPCTRADAAGRADAGRALVVGGERAEGVRHPLRDRDRRLRARAARDPRRGRGLDAALSDAPSQLTARTRARSRSRRPRRCSRSRSDERLPRRLAALARGRRGGRARGRGRRGARAAARARAPDRPHPRGLRPGRRAGGARDLPAAAARRGARRERARGLRRRSPRSPGRS